MRGGRLAGAGGDGREPHGIGDSLLARLEALEPAPPGHRVRRVLIILLLLLVLGSIGCDAAGSDGVNAAAGGAAVPADARSPDGTLARATGGTG